MSDSEASKKTAHRLSIERLREEIFEGTWIELQSHAERDAVFLISQNLDLAEVGFAIATDATAQVAPWVTAGQISRPTAAQLKSWSLLPQHGFRFVIVAPYVVIQDLAN